MSLKSKLKIAALGALCWFGYPHEAEADKSAKDKDFPAEVVKDATLSVRDSIMQALENNREANEEFGRELSKPWQRFSVNPGVKAPSYGNDPLLVRQLREGDLTMREDYNYYRNLAETLLTFKAIVDENCAPDPDQENNNKLQANRHATYLVQLPLGASRDNYLKKRLDVKLVESKGALVAEYKKYAFEVGRDGNAAVPSELQNPSRSKDVQKRIKARNSFVPSNYQAPVRQF